VNSTPSSASDSPPCILLADDDNGVLLSGKMLFGDQGWQVVTANNASKILGAVSGREFDVAMVDMNYTRDTTSGREGLELLDQLREADPDLPVVVMTAWATIPLAVEALKRGARDFVAKPWDNDRVLQLLAQVARGTRSQRRNRLLQETLRLEREDSIPQDFIAESPPMRELMEIIDRVGESEANIMILGENGTGKSVVAKLIHDRSLRREGPFINVNVGGLAEGVFESEIFGHVKGAFTDAKSDRAGRFELARGGTIFLDEIGNLSLPQQNKLLRLLETGEFERVGSSRTIRADARVISATNAPILEMVSEKAFREDLLYRLNTVVLTMPALRDRREDIPPMALRFLSEFCRKYHKTIRSIHSGAFQSMERYSWPGNVREMRHAIERAVLMCGGDEILPAHLMLQSPASSPAGSSGMDLEDMSMEDVERLLMQKALRKHQGNVTQAAQQLGMSRATFYRRMQDYQL
jgi:DNA-binding NtrC family response regulator